MVGNVGIFFHSSLWITQSGQIFAMVTQKIEGKFSADDLRRTCWDEDVTKEWRLESILSIIASRRIFVSMYVG